MAKGRPMGHKKRKREIAFSAPERVQPKLPKDFKRLPVVLKNLPTWSTVWMDDMEDTGTLEIPALPVRQSETPIIGYRTWSVVEKDGEFMLQSPVIAKEWEGPVLRSEKPSAHDPHAYPVPGTVHGLYAHNEPDWSDFLIRKERSWMVAWNGNTVTATFSPEVFGVAIGRVEATGTVVVHETGFRAEAMRIVKLVLSPHLMKHPGIIEQISRRYACDVSFDPTTLEDK